MQVKKNKSNIDTNLFCWFTKHIANNGAKVSR